jgi:hypothetical protein
VVLPYTTTVLAVALIVTGVRARARSDLRNGMLIGLTVWAVAVLLTALPVLTYLIPYSASVDRFIALCLGAAAIGYNIVRKPSIAPPTPPPTVRSDQNGAHWLGWVGVAGNVLLLVYAMRHGAKLGPSYLIHNLSSIRDKNFELAVNGVHGPIGILGSFLAPAGYLYLVIATKVKANRLLTVANFGLIVLVALFFYGGRQTIFVAVLLVVLGLWLRGAKLNVKPRTIVVVLVALVSVWYFTTSFVSQRQTVTDPRVLLHATSRTDYGPWTASRAESDPQFGSTLVQYSYLSSPIPSLMYYMNSGLAPKPLYGAYSLPLPRVFTGLLLGTYDPQAWSKARIKVFRPFKDTGYVANAWATLLRDLFADFGKAGAVLFCGLLGVFIAWARNRYEDTGEVFYHALEVYATLIFAFGAFQSLLWPDYMGNGFFLAWSIVIARHLLSPIGSRPVRMRPAIARGTTHAAPNETRVQ